jgi:predicted RNase H-like HicB family nuclease
MQVTAKAKRSGDWWAVEAPEIPGLFTQAKRLDQVADMVADAAEMLGHAHVEVVVEPQLSPADRDALDAAIAGRAQ